jgi:hypothetical protein
LGGRGPWDPEWALDLAARNGDEDYVGVARRDLEASMQPASPQWYGERLPVLWTLFMATREADPRALTVWMAETAHLLSDLPHDIVAHSIDRAIQTARHGFMPSVGEIRQIAEPLMTERKEHIDRLTKMEAALTDPLATATRERRRREWSLTGDQGRPSR